MSHTIYILMTMDCETARSRVSPHGLSMSPSGPADDAESERSIRGYIDTCKAAGYPATLFLHPEVTAAHPDMLLEMQSNGACLGLHLHPYKLVDSDWKHDLGAYEADEQRTILIEAVEKWERALGIRPEYFRAGYFSANDATFGILADLGFKGGSLSNPGRSLPSHRSVWVGALPYPHRADTAFRLTEGTGDFIEVPVAGAYGRPVTSGHAGEIGYEWPYIPHTYEHAAGVADIFRRFVNDRHPFSTYVTDTHNDHDYSDPQSAASVNLRSILDAIEAESERMDLHPAGITIDALCDRVREAST